MSGTSLTSTKSKINMNSLSFVLQDVKGNQYWRCKLRKERCRAKTSSGDRCSRISSYPCDYCIQHLRSVKGLEIKKSGIEIAGQGLWTTRPFKLNDVIGTYYGTRLNKRELDDLYPGNQVAPYAIQLRKGRYIDAACRRGFVSFTNHSFPNQNCTFYRRNESVILVCTKAVKAGRELFTDYGTEYDFGSDAENIHSTLDSRPIITHKSRKRKRSPVNTLFWRTVAKTHQGRIHSGLN